MSPTLLLLRSIPESFQNLALPMRPWVPHLHCHTLVPLAPHPMPLDALCAGPDSEGERQVGCYSTLFEILIRFTHASN